MTQTPDIFTQQVIQNALMATSDEMFDAFKRSSKSPIIYETLDFAVGITDAVGELVTQGNGVTGFLGTLDAAVKEVLGKWSHDIRAGDLFLTNNPYGGGGTHLSDNTIVRPVFDADRLVAFIANKAHWTEVGGMAPGSFTTDSSEIYQEGLQFICLRLARADVLDENLLAIIEANVRLPDMTLGDLHAGVAAVRIGERRVKGLCVRYGVGAVLDAMADWLDYGERMVLAALAQMPHGIYCASDSIDNDGRGNGPFPAQVEVRIDADRFVVDLTGSHAQVDGPINTTRTGLISRIRAVFLAATVPDIPANGGMFRALEVVCPDGTMFTATRPAPTSSYYECGIFAMDLVMKALAPAVSHRLPAGGFISVCATVISGRHPRTDELFVLVEPLTGGWGAGAQQDGQRGQFGPGPGETYNIPVEIAEMRYGVRIEHYGFHTLDAGAGRQRGGNGVLLEYLVTAEQVLFTGTYGRDLYPPWGVDGGQDGSGNFAEITRLDGSIERITKVARAALVRGERVRIYTGTGGGWGPASEREPSAVRLDLKNGYITAEQAREHYHVAL